MTAKPTREDFLLDAGSTLALPDLKRAESIRHHGSANSLQSHCLRTAWCALRIARMANLSRARERSAVQAALVHDLTGYPGVIGSRFTDAWTHGTYAMRNMERQIMLDHRQADAIRKHMFPLYPIPPRYTEGWILTLADKVTAAYELWLTAISKLGAKPKGPYVLRDGPIPSLA